MATSNDLTIRHVQKYLPGEDKNRSGSTRGLPPHAHAVIDCMKSLGELAADTEASAIAAIAAGRTVTWSDSTSRGHGHIRNMAANFMIGALRLAKAHNFDLQDVLIECVEKKNGRGFNSTSPNSEHAGDLASLPHCPATDPEMPGLHCHLAEGHEGDHRRPIANREWSTDRNMQDTCAVCGRTEDDHPVPHHPPHPFKAML